ncbi:MAG TPA: nucleoside hydrolase [Thermomicrobiales bacterium]|nr:nucleoside hydrolase [Thermomicrobiales bacterium]
MARPMLLDVDTGVDDAVAIALASRLESHELVAITTVAGNVPVEYSTANTQTVVAWMGLDVPIYRGMDEPLVRPLFDAREHHGFDGLGGWKPDVRRADIQLETAPEAIVRLARQHRGELTAVFVGPLTNLAVALSLEPRIVEWIDRLVIMGGAFFVPGNTTAAAEFNIYADPEAAAKVARSAFRPIWVPLDVTHRTGVTRSEWDRLANSDEPGYVLVREVMRQALTERGRPRFHLHDPLAVAVAVDPTIVSTRSGRVLVNVGPFERGRTILTDAIGTEPQGSVAVEVDHDRFETLLKRLVPLGTR